MLNLCLVLLGKILSNFSTLFNLGHGSTWPGHIALTVNKHFISQQLENANLKIIIVAGTNGKTTTSKLIKHILEHSGKKVIHNESGANLLNGIASSLVLNANVAGNVNAEYAIFEADENTLPLLLKEITPGYILLLNLFRDQLDRYGEVNSIAKNWNHAIENLPQKTTLILNADDPEIAYIGENKKLHSLYFGLNRDGKENLLEHAADSIHCPHCSSALNYEFVTLSHLGKWRCDSCGLKRKQLDISNFQDYPLYGTYNKYNTLAAVLLAKTLGISMMTITKSCKTFTPVFGRQETLTYNNKTVQIFLSKNPTGFNESLRTILTLDPKHILLILNDNIADGRDVSWIWDVDIEMISRIGASITVSGSRAYDMGLRIKYSSESKNKKFKIIKDIEEAIHESIKNINNSDKLYILPTYTAMLEVRKIITGKKIL